MGRVRGWAPLSRRQAPWIVTSTCPRIREASSRLASGMTGASVGNMSCSAYIVPRAAGPPSAGSLEGLPTSTSECSDQRSWEYEARSSTDCTLGASISHRAGLAKVVTCAAAAECCCCTVVVEVRSKGATSMTRSWTGCPRVGPWLKNYSRDKPFTTNAFVLNGNPTKYPACLRIPLIKTGRRGP